MRIIKLLSSITLAFGLAGFGANVSAHGSGPGTGTGTGASDDGIMVTRHFTGL